MEVDILHKLGPKLKLELLMRILKNIQKEIDHYGEERYKDGIAEGYSVAWRIFMWYSKNHELKEPNSLEKLEEWATKDLEELKGKLS